MALVVRKQDGETWRDAAKRYADRWGLTQEVMTYFDDALNRGVPEDQAALEACMEWDIADFEE